jgi:hypothetical protein
MMEETPADANRPCHYVESGTADVAGIPSPEWFPSGAGGGARSHRVGCVFRPTGQRDRRQHGDYAEEGWTARADDILEKVKRARLTLNKRQSV